MSLGVQHNIEDRVDNPIRYLVIRQTHKKTGDCDSQPNSQARPLRKMRCFSNGWRPALQLGRILTPHGVPHFNRCQICHRAAPNIHRSRAGQQPIPSARVFCSAQTLSTISQSSDEKREALARGDIFLYNTMERKKCLFKPVEPGKVTMYVCGVTVYDFSHIGHARAYVAFDVLYRLLQKNGYSVQYVRNFTDIDDKIINRANERGEESTVLSTRFINEFHTDMKLLGCKPPTAEPKATEYIPQIIGMIEKIIENGHGYEVDGDVYFNTRSLEGYGRLSGRKEDDNRAGERVAVDDRKKNAADFALWKSAKPDEPFWESPWGKGRPGWHIECSCMIKELIGAVVDIHGGGCDLVFPHHENELAQSQAASSPCEKDLMLNGTDFVRYWVHNGFVTVDNEKMSKSVGNFFTIRDVLQSHHPMAMRWMLLCTQYRQPLNYSLKALEEAAQNVYYVYQTFLDAKGVLEQAGPDGVSALDQATAQTGAGEGLGGELANTFVKTLNDDLNTAVAISEVFGALKIMNDLVHTKKGKKLPDRLERLASHIMGIGSCLNILGFETEDPGVVLGEIRNLTLQRANMTEQEVQAAIDERNEARKAKDYERADAARAKLLDVGILMCDTPQGTTWRPGK